MTRLAQFPALLLVALTLVLTPLAADPAGAQGPLQALTGSGPDSAPDEGSGEGRGNSEPLRQLLEVLRDDQARDQLITELEQTLDSQGQGDGGAEDGEASSVGDDLRSIGAEVAEFTQQSATNVRGSAVQLWRQIVGTVEVVANVSAADFEFIVWLMARLSALIAITYGGLFAMRRLTDRLRNRLKLTIRYEGWLAKTLAVAATFLVDLINMGVPWALGYVFAFALLDPRGDISFAQSLYLNAFIVVEIAMAVLRTILAPQRDEARLVPLDGAQSGAILRWSRAIGLLLVYGQLLVLPLLVNHIPSAEGRAISVIGLAIVLAMLAAGTIRAHGYVSELITSSSNNRRGLRVLARYWHVPVLIYIAILFLVALARPLGGFYAVLWTNFRMLAVIVAGIILMNVLTRAIGRGVRLPEDWRSNIPLLERRVNSFVPKMLMVARLVVMLGVLAYCAHALGLLDMVGFLASEIGIRVVWSALSVALLLVGGFAAWLIISTWVEHRIGHGETPLVSSRERTLLVLLRNAVTVALIIIIGMFVLSELGLNITPLLASAGVIGLAIGFGAQKAVQDIITGIFIQLEGAIDVGDVVSIGGIAGVVERLTIRSAALRDLEGCYHVVPFSSVDTVTNYMREYSYALIDMGVAYREDLDEAKQAMFDAFEELKQDEELKNELLDELEWMGLNSFGASELILRARIKTNPGLQWQAKRAYNAIVKRIFDERGIEIPFPHHTVYFGEDKAGKAPPLRMTTEPEMMQEPPPDERTQESARTRQEDSVQDDEAEDQSGKKMPDPDAGPED